MTQSFRRFIASINGRRPARQTFNHEILESRRLFSAAPTDFEQYMLQLINRARANPAAEAARLGIDLNEGLAPGTISNAPLPPLVFNPDLVESAQDYNSTLLGLYNYFAQSYNGTTPQSRMAAAGYVFSGSYISTESLNVDYEGYGHGHVPYVVDSASTASQYQQLFLDSNASSRGDRLNILDTSFREIGIGVNTRTTYQGLDVPPDQSDNFAIMTAVDYAASDADPNPILTGVAYVDLTGDQFYAPGDGIGNATITATRASDLMTFSTTTFASGGYSLAVPAGTYTVVASGGGLPTPITLSNVTVTTQNVEADFVVPSSAGSGASIGGLDPSFANGGLASHNVGFTSTSDVLLQSDGKSVIIGTGGASPSQSLGVTRYNADGSLDTAFGTGGVVFTSAGGDDQAVGGSLLPDGDILVAGTATTFSGGVPAGSQFILAEYTPGGALDPQFGGGAGFVLTSFSSNAAALSNDVAHAIVVSPTGEIFVGGSSDASGAGLDFAVAAYNADGSAATNFGNGGKTLLDFSGGNDSIASLALQPKGSIVAAGSTSAGGVESVALARFLSTGAPDPHFGLAGKIVTSVRGIADAASSIAVTPKTGSLVVGGFSATGSASDGSLTSDFLVLRYTSTGKLDRTFHGNGMEITTFGQPAAVTSVIVESDGNILAAGKSTASLTTLDPSGLSLALAQYTAAGVPDVGFHGTGHALISLAGAASQSLTSPSIPRVRPYAITAFDAASDLMAAFNQLTQSDEAAAAVTSGGELLEVGSSGANTVEAAIVTVGLDLSAALVGSLPNSVVGGGKGAISLAVRETGTQLASGAFTVQLFTSTSGLIPLGQAPFASIPAKLKLKQGKMVVLHLKFVYPSSLSAGSYNVSATIVAGSARDLNLGNNTAVVPGVEIAAPFIDLSGSGLIAPTFAGTAAASVSFTVTNNGNIPTPPAASSVEFLASADGTLASAISIATQPFKPNLKPSASRVFKTKLALPATLPAGSYFLLVLLDPSNVFNDTNTGNNLIASGSMFTVT